LPDLGLQLLLIDWLCSVGGALSSANASKAELSAASWKLVERQMALGL
jgi:hypothetical protein